MIETNIRVVKPGTDLWVWTKKAKLSGTKINYEFAEKVCNTIRFRHGLAAAPSIGDPSQLLVATRYPVESVHLVSEDWEVDLADAGEPAAQLMLNTSDGEKILPDLIERALLTQVSKTDLWNADSPRIWYEASPFKVVDGIAAFSRHEIGTVLIDGIGMGISVDIATGFFSDNTLAFYFDPSLSVAESKEREQRFMEMIGRQEGQSGTLLYDHGRGRSKCYFVSAPRGLTCGSTGKIRARGKSYESLLEYYNDTNPGLVVSASTPAVLVSFRKIDRPQPVAADRVRARVVNDDLPDQLSDASKIAPAERRDLIEQFWTRLGPKPFGAVAPGVGSSFWRPPQANIRQFAMPVLTFGKGRSIPSPARQVASVYKQHFLQRMDALKECGYYFVPPSISRTLNCAYPKSLGTEEATAFASSVVEQIQKATDKPISAQLTAYDSVSQAIELLRDKGSSGFTVFILNGEPNAYYQVEYQLNDWKVKRLTEHTLLQQYRYLTQGAYDKQQKKVTLEAGQRRWNSFINLNVLDIAQGLDAIPFRIDQAGMYEGQLVIDVGHDRRYFAVSLLVARNEKKNPSFRFFTNIQDKVDLHQEAINPILLMDEISELFSQMFRRQFDPLESLLIIRDGKLVKDEPVAIDNCIARLKDKNYLSKSAIVDQVDVHKETLKSIRMWDINATDQIENPLIGTGILLNKHAMALANTGAPGVTQGTAEPILIVSNGRCADIVRAAEANFASAQLNWSSPGVPQHLGIGMKRTDEELKSRAAQEVRRLR